MAAGDVAGNVLDAAGRDSSKPILPLWRGTLHTRGTVPDVPSHDAERVDTKSPRTTEGERMKSCPYCGGAELRTVVTHRMNYVVQCEKCLARGPEQLTRAAAEEAWGTRRDDER